ncbi:MAG TPA: hypothetical protein VKE51_01880 [Vicinamibacterales bacterium]|nr:hypothetical protein [Vicinamibacterales bacterium]
MNALSAAARANAVHRRLPQVRLQRADTTDFEVFNLRKRSKQGLLDKIIRVRHVARPPRQTAADPPAKRAEVPRHQPLERFLVSLPHSLDQLKR